MAEHMHRSDRKITDKGLLKLFEDQTVSQNIKRVFKGLGQPKDSGEHKYAKQQMTRLWAVVAAVIVPCMTVAGLMMFGNPAPPPERVVKVRIIEPEAPEELEDIEELFDEPLEPPEPVEMDFVTPEVAVAVDSPIQSTPETDFSPQPMKFDSVAMVKSPVIMKGIYGSRGSAGARGAAIRQFGGTGLSEGAVIKALRWLKREQTSDGSWQSPPVAMTSFALLTFLAHGETPASEEFGPTVEKAIRYLVGVQNPNGRFPGNYDIPIGTYAICEAYALTKVPMLRGASERAVDVVIKGQNPTGGWNYNCNNNPKDGKYRDDTSYMGWCAQALKAAKMAGLENEGLDKAIKLAVKGFQKNAHPQGGFGYIGPGAGGLTGVGVLCMQLLGAARKPEARRGLRWLDQVTCNWDEPWGGRPIYYWYYVTQAKFHAGDSIWKQWNTQFARELVKNQQILKGEGIDGKDVGFWKAPGEKEKHGLVYNTTLCALMLQVYYRYLPTFKPPKDDDFEEEFTSEGDIQVEITI